MLDRNQWMILAQGAAASSIIMIGLFSQDSLRDLFDLPGHALADRMAFAIRWLALPGLMLLIGIQGVATGRFLSDAVDGTRTPASHRLELNLRYNLNTLEQAFLAAIAYMGLAVTLEHSQLVIIPFFAILFVIGRIFFWVGYLLDPVARGFGLVLTFLPTVGGYAWLVMRLVTP
jgi:MAPEG family